MKKYISFGKLKKKYIIIILLYTVFFVYKNCLIKKTEIYKNSKLLDPLLYYIGNILCIFPLLFIKKNFKKQNVSLKNKLDGEHKGIITYIYNNPYEKYLTAKEIIMVVTVSILKIVENFCNLFSDKMNEKFYNYNEEINNDYFFISFIIWFLFSNYYLKINHYKHQYISIIAVTIIGIIKLTYLSIKTYINKSFNMWWLIELLKLFIELLSILTSSIGYGYIKGLMEYKFFSPYKCCFIVGIINLPIILIIYIIVSYIPCYSNVICNNEEERHFDNINILFTRFNLKEIILLTLFTFLSGVKALLINKTMNDFTLYHIIIPIQIAEFVKDMIKSFDIYMLIIFIFEFFFYLVFLEIVELNICDLNKNIRKNITKRASYNPKFDERSDSDFALYENNDDEEEENNDILIGEELPNY